MIFFLALYEVRRGFLVQQRRDVTASTAKYICNQQGCLQILLFAFGKASIDSVPCRTIREVTREIVREVHVLH